MIVLDLSKYSFDMEFANFFLGARLLLLLMANARLLLSPTSAFMELCWRAATVSTIVNRIAMCLISNVPVVPAR